jgi:hypothetical protein
MYSYFVYNPEAKRQGHLLIEIYTGQTKQSNIVLHGR